jgi:hypothetical protein
MSSVDSRKNEEDAGKHFQSHAIVAIVEMCVVSHQHSRDRLQEF